MSSYPGLYPTDRVAAVVNTWLNRQAIDNTRHLYTSGEPLPGSQAWLAEASGVSERTLYAILSGERKTASLAIVDRLFTTMGCAHLFHVPAEAGGFADVYERDMPVAPIREVQHGFDSELPPPMFAVRAA